MEEAKHSPIYRVVAAHKSDVLDPLLVKTGEKLKVEAKQTVWSGWLWCTNQSDQSGWMPENYLVRQGNTGIARQDYDATELSVDIGEELIMGYEESGWIWCANQQGQHGWVPADHLEILGEGSKQ